MEPDPLLRRPDHLPNVVDYRGRPIGRFTATGRWNSALFIIGVEMAERSAYYGISTNLIMYLTDHLGQSTASAAAGVNTWYGVAMMMPLVGAFVADSYLGRYRTILVASLLYLLGLGMLTMSAIMSNLMSPHLQVALFYFSLYLVAFAQGGHKPCVQAFGADQFDRDDPQECALRSSFFNWWNFGMGASTLVSLLALTYVQDNLGWGLGFGIPCVLMAVAVVVFLMGTRTYRFYELASESPFARIGRAFAQLAQNGGAAQSLASSDGSGFLLEGATRDIAKTEEDGSTGPTSINEQLEEAKGLLRLLPIWASCLIFAIILAQPSTLFTKQASTMDRRLRPTGLQLPPASLQSLICVTLVAFLPLYDRILVPAARKFSESPSGFTPLQRIGAGIAVSIVLMVVAALVEKKRLRTAGESGLVDRPGATVPMSVWWLVPQYVIYGVADAFSVVGLQEFFYDQVPDALRSLGLALYLSIFGIGSFVSSFLVPVIDEVTGRTTGESWFSDNLNRAHLDYFYWLLAGLSAVAPRTQIWSVLELYDGSGMVELEDDKNSVVVELEPEDCNGGVFELEDDDLATWKMIGSGKQRGGLYYMSLLLRYAQAMFDPHWQRAMDAELEALHHNNTWSMVPLPDGHKLISCKWVYKIKYKSDGTIEHYMALLVAKGHTQAPRNWFFTFSNTIQKVEYHQSKADYPLFTKVQGTLFTAVLIYVDDILLIGNDLQEMECLKDFFLKCFCMKDLGDLKYFLGIEFSRSKKGIFMSQRKYALDIFQDSGLLGARPDTFSMEQNLTLTLTDGALLKDPTKYRRLVGKLIYLTVTA